MTNFAVAVVRYSLVALGIIVSPLYGLWVFGGHLADKRGQRLYREASAASDKLKK